MTFEVILDPRAIKDAQSIIDYYDDQQIGLGKKFESELNGHLKILYKAPFFKFAIIMFAAFRLINFLTWIHFTSVLPQEVRMYGVQDEVQSCFRLKNLYKSLKFSY